MLRAAFHQRVGPTERRKLLAGIHAQAHALALDDDTRRDLQQKLTGMESCRDMSEPQLRLVWTRLTALAHDAGLSTPHSAPRTRNKRPGRDERQPAEPPTTEQLDKIEHLYEDLHIIHRPMVVMALCRRVTKSEAAPDGHPWPQTRAEANRLVEALKAMAARQWRPRDVEPSEVDRVETGGTDGNVEIPAETISQDYTKR